MKTTLKKQPSEATKLPYKALLKEAVLPSSSKFDFGGRKRISRHYTHQKSSGLPPYIINRGLETTIHSPENTENKEDSAIGDEIRSLRNPVINVRSDSKLDFGITKMTTTTTSFDDRYKLLKKDKRA